ncbi:DUF3558 domain-containing protein [Rhodococcus sp. HNM0563]|uniref:DUF3558 family protein n=1 Tax=unclassified Rhodococcus (in: high G+C Gram-positive bacteria) TaxID=192944 RepID=UPI00146F703B|nr:DUF3558 domain-containing protein [Rhodococcus sp. F64268]MCK0093099.1 DUF3558 domain-containing protein [Rhodococcus sp. F64268]NLU65082.1 DUF3558 domain-containing protein [Rhodococcus sp. HNM0563]
MGSIALLAATTACGTDAPPEASPNTADTVPSTTRTPRVVDDSGRPAITFDPCLDLPDDVLVDAQYDPKYKRPSENPMGSYSFLGCGFRGTLSIPDLLEDYRLSILAGNVTLEEEWDKDGDISTRTRVNGRDALLQLDPNMHNNCSIAVRTDFGIVIFSRTHYAPDARVLPTDEWCTGLHDTVALFEPFIDRLPHSAALDPIR